MNLLLNHVKELPTKQSGVTPSSETGMDWIRYKTTTTTKTKVTVNLVH